MLAEGVARKEVPSEMPGDRNVSGETQSVMICTGGLQAFQAQQDARRPGLLLPDASACGHTRTWEAIKVPRKLRFLSLVSCDCFDPFHQALFLLHAPCSRQNSKSLCIPRTEEEQEPAPAGVLEFLASLTVHTRLDPNPIVSPFK